MGIRVPHLRLPFQRPRLEDEIEACIRAGTGLRQEQWLWTKEEIEHHDLLALSGSMVDWCSETMGSFRRPYGIDHVALSVACARPGQPIIASATFGVFRPVHFYQEEGPRQQLEAFLHNLDVELLNRQAPPLRFAAALFSWGEVAKATVFADRP